MVLLPLSNGLFVADVGDAFCGDASPRLRCVVQSADLPDSPAIISPHVSPDGVHVAFVAAKEVWVVRLDGNGPVVQATAGAQHVDGLSHGTADFLSAEEFDRYDGLWWSPDGTALAVQRTDERSVAKVPIVHQADMPLSDPAALETHRYPLAGETNPSYAIGVVSLEGSLPEKDQARTVTQAANQPSWLDVTEASYIPRIGWVPDGSLAVQMCNRLQTHWDLVRFDATMEHAQVLLREESESSAWIDVHDDLRWFRGPDSELYFLWKSEVSGYAHLTLYKLPSSESKPAEPVRVLTGGRWMVTSVVEVVRPQEADGAVYFHANATSPLEQHLYAVPLWDVSLFSRCGWGAPLGAPLRDIEYGTLQADMEEWGAGMEEWGMVRVTTGDEAGRWHEATLSPDGTNAIVSSAAAMTAARARFVRILARPREGTTDPGLPTEVRLDLGPEPASRASSTGFDPSVHFFTCPAADPAVTLYGVLVRPNREKFGRGPYPTVVKTYGGPGIQFVRNEYSRLGRDASSFDLAREGALVVRVDNRGSSGRGVRFSSALKHRFGTVEPDDQVAALDFLADQELVDTARVGISGWSYGGYMTLMCLFRHPDRFHVGIAGAPVVRWEDYDTAYTERYMGLPESNPEGYRTGAVTTHVGDMAGRLLLFHGLLDENVLFRHSAQLINALVDGDKDFDMHLLPSCRHGPRRPSDRAYLLKKMNTFWKRNLFRKCE